MSVKINFQEFKKYLTSDEANPQMKAFFKVLQLSNGKRPFIDKVLYELQDVKLGYISTPNELDKTTLAKILSIATASSNLQEFYEKFYEKLVEFKPAIADKLETDEELDFITDSVRFNAFLEEFCTKEALRYAKHNFEFTEEQLEYSKQLFTEE